MQKPRVLIQNPRDFPNVVAETNQHAVDKDDSVCFAKLGNVLLEFGDALLGLGERLRRGDDERLHDLVFTLGVFGKKIVFSPVVNQKAIGCGFLMPYPPDCVGCRRSAKIAA